MAAEAAQASSLLIKPGLWAGIIIALYEILLVHRDVRVATHRFGHAIHAAIFALLATFINFNVPFVLEKIPALENIPFIGTVIGLRIAVGIIMMIKIHASSAAVKGMHGSTMGMRETWVHSFIVGILTIIAPYVWPYISPLLPSFMR